MARKPTIKSLQAKADAAWRNKVLNGHKKCAVCDDKPAEQAHHIFHKKMFNKFRYDVRNGLPVCRGCHHLDKYRPASTVVAAIRFMGHDSFFAFVEELIALNEPKRWKRRELELILEGLAEWLK